MAHFARLDENNQVVEVVVVSNDDILDEDDNENEQVGMGFLKSLYGQNTVWRQTSYNNNFRGRYAHIDDTFVENVSTLGVASTSIFLRPNLSNLGHLIQSHPIGFLHLGPLQH